MVIGHGFEILLSSHFWVQANDDGAATGRYDVVDYEDGRQQPGQQGSVRTLLVAGGKQALAEPEIKGETR